MTEKLLDSTDPDIVGSFAALRRAAKRALQIGLETNTPVYVIQNGRIVDLTEEHRLKVKSPRVRGVS